MFTGLIECIGKVRSLTPTDQLLRLSISANFASVRAGEPLVLGESIAIDGVCLTVVSAASECFEVEAARETLALTTLGKRIVGDAVHLERALPAGARLGGHFVSGHVDATGTIAAIEAVGDARSVRFELETVLLSEVAKKGSIAVDGVSLTVNEVDSLGCEVMLIPHTLAAHTHFVERGRGCRREH